MFGYVGRTFELALAPRRHRRDPVDLRGAPGAGADAGRARRRRPTRARTSSGRASRPRTTTPAARASRTTTPSPRTSAARTGPAEGVDVETGGGITDVGWVRSGEWLSYTVNATAPQSVVLRLRASNPDAAGKRVRVSTGDGYPAAVVVPPTGSFGTFALAVSTPFWLPAGATAIRLDFDGVRAGQPGLARGRAGRPAGRTTITHGPHARPWSPTPRRPYADTDPALAISAPGRYTLDHDLVVRLDGVLITSSDVVLDGMGHTIEGPRTPGSTWVGRGSPSRGRRSDAPHAQRDGQEPDGPGLERRGSTALGHVDTSWSRGPRRSRTRHG